MSWPWYAQYLRVETAWWIYLETFESSFQVLFWNWSIPVWMEKAIVVPVFKKGDRQLLKYHRPISLLPINGKVFGRLLYSQMFEFFMRNDLILMLVSKAFDKIWHQGLLPKLKQNGISVNMLEALTDFFKRLRANICIEWTNLLVRKC